MPRSVLVVDAVATHRIRLAALFGSARYAVSVVAHTDEIRGAMGDYDLVVVGVPSDQLGQEVARAASVFQGASTPILALDARTSPLRRLLALRAGACDVLPSKSPDDLLLARARGLIRESEEERECERRRLTAASFGLSEASAGFAPRGRIVCCGPLGTLPEGLSALLAHEVVTCPADDLVEDDSGVSMPDAVILGLAGGGGVVERLLPDLRDRMHMRPAPILAVYPTDRPDLATRALALGASEAVVDVAGIEELELRITNTLARKRARDALRRSDEQSYRLAATDPLTGLYNRRYAETYLCDLAERAGQMANGLCLVLVDLDHFKAVNDAHGHVAGDHVLCEVAHRMQDNMRAFDLVARYGGEEFLIVLPEAPPEEAAVISERLRTSIAARPVRLKDGTEIAVTVSIGVASGLVQSQLAAKRTGTYDAVETRGFGPLLPVFEAADAALYRAKDAGRNRVEVTAA